MAERNIVVDCSQLSRVSEILQQAQQVGMTTLAQSYFITSLVICKLEALYHHLFCKILFEKKNSKQDMHILDYDQYKQGGANITGLRMVDPHRRETIDVLAKWNNWEFNTGKNLNVSEKTLTVL